MNERSAPILSCSCILRTSDEELFGVYGEHDLHLTARVEVRAESISQAVGSIEERHPGRKVQVVFPIDPEEFFVGGPQEQDRTGAEHSCTIP